MFLPIGDTPNPPRFNAYVNFVLIGLNVAIYLLVTIPLSSREVDINDPAVLEYMRMLAENGLSVPMIRDALSQLSAYDLFVFRHGFKPGAPEVADLFFSMFLHGGFLHLAGNMLFLWIFGDNVEHRLGRLGYLLVYLFTGVVATVAFAMFARESTIPLVGASGAISGVLGIYFLLFRHNRVKVFVFLFPFIMDVWLISARLVLGFYLVVDNLLPVFLGSGGGVAHGAHIGGFVGGLGVAWLGEKINWAWPWTDRRRPGAKRVHVVDGGASDGYVPDLPLPRLRHFMAATDVPNALSSLDRLYMHDVEKLEPPEVAQLSDWLQRSGRAVAATRLVRQALTRGGDRPDAALLYLALGRLRLQQGQPTAAYHQLLGVFDASPSPEVEQETRKLLAEIQVFRQQQ